MKVWTNNTFQGFWPVGSAAVVFAETAEDAANGLNVSLSEHGLKQDPELKAEDMLEMKSTDDITVRILCDGNY